jgi:hypothetical protein
MSSATFRNFVHPANAIGDEMEPNATNSRPHQGPDGQITMIECVEVEDAANPFPKLAIEPALELERALSFGWISWGISWGKRGLGTVLVDVVDDAALNDAPGILEHRHESARPLCA